MPQRAMSWLERLSLSAYGLLMRSLQPLLRRKLQRRGQQEPGYLQQIPQRFGVYDSPALAPGCVWVHAVSLGETRAAGLLIDALRQRLPGMRLLLTHSTATGWAQGQSLLQPGDVQVWLPWDTPEATRRFLQHHRPRCGILMETEVWPSLVQACQEQAVPLVLVNARLNDKSLRSAQRLAWLSGPAYRGLTGVLAQSEADAERLRTLGARVDAVLGNLKFDVQPQPQALSRAQQWRAQWTQGGQSRPVLMLASTREGEEALWLDALASNAARGQAFADAGCCGCWCRVTRSALTKCTNWCKPRLGRYSGAVRCRWMAHGLQRLVMHRSGWATVSARCRSIFMRQTWLCWGAVSCRWAGKT